MIQHAVLSYTNYKYIHVATKTRHKTRIIMIYNMMVCVHLLQQLGFLDLGGDFSPGRINGE